MDFTFAKNMEVVSLDPIPEKFKVYYKAKDDGSGFKVDVENPVVKNSVEIVTGLHSSLSAARVEAQGVKGKAVDLSALGEFGNDVASIVEGIKNKMTGLETQLTEAQKGGKINPEKIRQEVAAQFAKDGEAKDKRNIALTKQLYTLLVDNKAIEAIGSQGDPELLMPFITKQVRVVEEDETWKVNVVDDKNEVKFSGTTGQPLTVKELVAQMKGNPTFQPLFKSDAPSGGGSNNQQTNMKTDMNQKPEMNAVDKISMGLQKGQHLKHAAPAGKEIHL